MSRFVAAASFLLIIPAIYFAFFPGKIVAVTILCSYPLLFAGLFIIKSRNSPIDEKGWLVIFQLYNLILFIRGVVDASSYQDWTTLLSTGIAVTLFLPFLIYFGSSVPAFSTLIRILLKYILFGVLVIMFVNPHNPGPYGFTRTISPIYMLVILIPYLNFKYTCLVVVLTVMSFFSDITVRSNLINILVASVICGTYFFRDKRSMLRAIKLTRAVLLTLPVVFFILGITGLYNVFTIGDSFNGFIIEDGAGRKQEVFVDSRTPIYIDVLSELNRQEAFVWGLGALGKTETSLVDVSGAEFYRVYKEGRRGTESGMLNVLQWGGFVGATIYFMLFVRASFLGIFQSKNWFSVMMGIWVAYKGLYSFVGDELIFSLASLPILVPVGVCFSRNIRNGSDEALRFLVHKVSLK